MRDRLGKRRRSQRPCSDDYNSVSGKGPGFCADDLDVRVGADAARHFFAETFAVNGERRACRHRDAVGDIDEQRAAAPQFFFEHEGRGSRLIGFERIGADDFAQVGGAMRRRRACRAHFVKADLRAALCGLPRGFAARQSAADDGDAFVSHFSSPSYNPLNIQTLRLEASQVYRAWRVWQVWRVPEAFIFRLARLHESVISDSLQSSILHWRSMAINWRALL